MTADLTPQRRPDDIDAALRPKGLDEFIGQQGLRENLGVFIAAARGRGGRGIVATKDNVG